MGAAHENGEQQNIRFIMSNKNKVGFEIPHRSALLASLMNQLLSALGARPELILGMITELLQELLGVRSCQTFDCGVTSSFKCPERGQEGV